MNRTLLIVSGALIVGGLALFMVYMDAYIEEATGGPRIAVVTAAEDIEIGRPIQIGWLTTKDIPESYVEDRHLRASDLRRLIGVPLAQSVRSGEAILRTDLSSISGQRRTLSGEIPPGMRALSIEVRPESSHAGLLRPGDRVDVLLTVGDPRVPNSGRAVVVAQKVLVISVGQTIHSTFDTSRDLPRYDVIAQVSVEVGLEEAQRITLAQRQGALRLVLRNPNDVGEVETVDVTEPELLTPSRRADWVRRFALVERPEITTETEPGAPPAP